MRILIQFRKTPNLWLFLSHAAASVITLVYSGPNANILFICQEWLWLITLPCVLSTHPIDFVSSPLHADKSANLHFLISQVNEAP